MTAKTAETKVQLETFIALALVKLGVDYRDDADSLKVLRKKSAVQMASNIARLTRMADFDHSRPAAPEIMPAFAAEERKSGKVDNSSKHAAKGTGLTTPKQLEWLIKLHQEKLGLDLLAEANEDLLKAMKNLTWQNASAAMDRLFKMPRWEQVQAATAAQGHTPIAADVPSTEVAPVETDPKVLPGRYVVKGQVIRVSQGKKGSQWFGTTFVKDVETDRNLKGAARAEVLAYIAANPAECALEYTKLTGCCSNCNRELINAESIEAAMGPICSGKFGRAYGMTILGEIWVEKPKRAKKDAAPAAIEREVLEGEIVEDAPVIVQAEDRFKGYALPAAPAAVAEPNAAPVRSIAKGTGVAKAERVLAAVLATGGAAKLDTYAGVTRVHGVVDGKQLLVTWDGVSFRYGAESTLGGKKFRNVSELLRLIG